MFGLQICLSFSGFSLHSVEQTALAVWIFAKFDAISMSLLARVTCNSGVDHKSIIV